MQHKLPRAIGNPTRFHRKCFRTNQKCWFISVHTLPHRCFISHIWIDAFIFNLKTNSNSKNSQIAYMMNNILFFSPGWINGEAMMSFLMWIGAQMYKAQDRRSTRRIFGYYLLSCATNADVQLEKTASLYIWLPFEINCNSCANVWNKTLQTTNRRRNRRKRMKKKIITEAAIVIVRFFSLQHHIVCLTFLYSKWNEGNL